MEDKSTCGNCHWSKRGRIVWNKGNASKERIFGYCKKYSRQIFWILTNNDFQFAKAFWGEECVCHMYLKSLLEKGCWGDNEHAYVTIAWAGHLQKMVTEEDPILYLKDYI